MLSRNSDIRAEQVRWVTAQDIRVSPMDRELVIDKAIAAPLVLNQKIVVIWCREFHEAVITVFD